MSQTERRRFLSVAMAAVSSLLGACGGGGDGSGPPAAGPDLPPMPPTPPAPPAPAPQAPPSPVPMATPALGKYRSTQDWLFLDTTAATSLVAGAGNWFETPARPSVAAPSAGFKWGSFGPSSRHVEAFSEWAWVNAGGDWINTAGTPQATNNPHFSFGANTATSGSANYTASITAGVQAAQSGARWNAYIVKCTGGIRAIASHHHATLPAPRIDVTYTDGSTATLACVACTRLVSSTAYAQLGNAEALIDQGVALEFERPTKPVSSAMLRLTLTQHTATAATVNGYLANPPLNTAAVETGLANTYPADAGLGSHPDVLFAHRYQDGSTLNDWVHPNSGLNIWTTSNWSPHLFGTGAADTTKLPYQYGAAPAPGKWFYKQYTTNVSLVNSSYSGEGFAPLAPGLGALRVVIPASSAADGAAMPPAGSLGADLWAVFDEPHCGTLDRVYTRFYVRFGSAPAPLGSTKMFRQTGNTAYYATRGGKFGPGVHHWTFYGGNNNVGGGNIGWTNRCSWTELPADAPLGGILPGCHSWDMIGRDLHWGQAGGLGGAMFPDRWYCVEVDCQLNTFNPAGGSPSDGVMTIRIDGRVAAVHTGWKYRDGPINYTTTPLANLPPFRSLGPTGLAINDYNGGVLPGDRDMVIFYTGVVASKSYIGPMAATTPGLNLSGSTWSPNRDADGKVLASDFAQLPLMKWLDVAGTTSTLNSAIETPHAPQAGSTGGDGTHNIVNAWGGAAWDYQNQRMIIAGGGHGDTIEYATGIYGVTADKLTFERLVNSQPASTIQSWNFSTHQLEPVSRGNATTAPLTSGVPPFMHTYDGLVWVPPGLPGAGATKGGLFIPGNARSVVNLDNGVYQTTHWFNPETHVQDWSYCIAFLDGQAIYGPRGSWYHFKYDLQGTQATTWNANSFGVLTLTLANSTVPFAYANKLWGQLRERREQVSFSASGVRRVRYGQAIDANATDWSSYHDTITLTSSDGSHADFNATTLADDGALSSAGIHYDHSVPCLWVQANPVGGQLYQITGLASNSWTVAKFAGTGARYGQVHMTYGRFKVATVAGIKLALRVSSTNDPLQVMRLA